MLDRDGRMCVPRVIPEALESQVEKTVTFEQILESPIRIGARWSYWAGRFSKPRP